MFNFSGSEIVFLLLLALIILGPEKLPEAVRKFGKTYAEFKKVTTGFQNELKSALDEPMREMKETADALRKAAQFDIDLDPKSMFAGLTGTATAETAAPAAAPVGAAAETTAVTAAAPTLAPSPDPSPTTSGDLVPDPSEPTIPVLADASVPDVAVTPTLDVAVTPTPTPTVIAGNEPPLASGATAITPRPADHDDGVAPA